MDKRTKTPKPAGLRIVYVVLGWLTAVGTAGFVLAILAAADPNISDHPSKDERTVGDILLGTLIALVALSIYLLAKAEEGE